MFKLILFAITLFAAFGNAQNAGEVLKSVQQKFNGINDLSADFTRYSGGSNEYSGKFFYKKDNKIRLELKNSIIISDGETNWNYSKKGNKVVISKFDDSDPLALSIQKVLYKYPSECKISSESAGEKQVLVFVPEDSSDLSFNKVKITLNKENLIDEISIDDPNIGVIEIALSNYKLNRNIPDNKFTFSPPEGSKVIDLRAE
ncbi:MAG TPA: outer membrane lipoprotein carrier protein LolA [Ignavibacteriaceae bacterium]|nr:outer membrane lipoprotein carrier protein LolA [Ignavibacteriaceae bacterium]